MTAPFTSPAPWSVNASGGARTIVARDRSVVAVVVGSNGAAPFEVGNGALMAAAPEIYRALQFAFEHAPKSFYLDGKATPAEWIEIARAALAKVSSP